MMADPTNYLADTCAVLRTHWPENRTVNLVCHGHSVPAGYFATPFVDTFNAYPHLLHRALKHRFPFAVINVIVTAIGGENSERGAARFEQDVLSHRPDVLTLDYGLNDRGLAADKADTCWRSMIEMALAHDIRVLLMTPSADITQRPGTAADQRDPLQQHAARIRNLAAEYSVGLVDSLAAFTAYTAMSDLSDLLSWSNHPNRAGHEQIVRELLRWFPAAG